MYTTAGRISLTEAFEDVGDSTPLEKGQAVEEGRAFWKRFKEKLKNAICNDPKIQELMLGQGSLKDYLMVGIPL